MMVMVLNMIVFVAIIEILRICPKTYSQILVFQNFINSHANFQHNFVNGVICHQEQELQVSKRISCNIDRNGR